MRSNNKRFRARRYAYDDEKRFASPLKKRFVQERVRRIALEGRERLRLAVDKEVEPLARAQGCWEERRQLFTAPRSEEERRLRLDSVGYEIVAKRRIKQQLLEVVAELDRRGQILRRELHETEVAEYLARETQEQAQFEAETRLSDDKNLQQVVRRNKETRRQLGSNTSGVSGPHEAMGRCGQTIPNEGRDDGSFGNSDDPSPESIAASSAYRLEADGERELLLWRRSEDPFPTNRTSLLAERLNCFNSSSIGVEVEGDILYQPPPRGGFHRSPRPSSKSKAAVDGGNSRTTA